MATASQEERPAVTITNQACGEILIQRVNEIMVSQGKAMDQALQVTRHIVDNYEKQGRLNHLYDHLNDRDWIGKWVTQALAQNPTPHRPVTPATVRTTNRTKPAGCRRRSEHARLNPVADLVRRQRLGCGLRTTRRRKSPCFKCCRRCRRRRREGRRLHCRAR